MPRSKGLSKELRMLSPNLPPMADRAAEQTRNRIAQAVTPATGNNNASEDSGDIDATPNVPPRNQEERSNLLDVPGGGDIAANVPAAQENVPHRTPEPPKGKGKHSFEALPPVNVLVPMDLLKATFENVMICPRVGCPSKGDDSNDCHALEVEHQQCGFATEVYITCNCCGWGTAMCPLESETKADTPNGKEPKKKRAERDSEQFHGHGINYASGFMMQKLGMGLKGLDVAFSFLGIAPNHGSDRKWNRLLNRIGLASHQVADEAMEENRKKEVDLTTEKADEEALAWLQSEEGKDATPETADAKRNEMLKVKGGKAGITMSGDAGWQKRKTGKNGGDSNAGHNLGVGCLSEKTIAAQSYSQKCRIHSLAKKLGIEPKAHRCPLNFDATMSSKAMEPMGGVQHCIDIANGAHNCYVDGFVMDDDSATRANLKHSCAAAIERDNPGTVVNGKTPSRSKRALGWPVGADPSDLDERGRYISDGALPPPLVDYGKMPIGIPCPTVFWSDPQHRIRNVGGAFFDCRVKNAKATTKTDDGLLTEECNNAKRNFGCCLKRNQGCSDEDFETKAECVLLHLFNDHTLCDEHWCSHLKAKAKIAAEAAAVATTRADGGGNGTTTSADSASTAQNEHREMISAPSTNSNNGGNNELTNSNNPKDDSDAIEDTESESESDDENNVEDTSKYRSLKTKEEKELCKKVREKAMPLLTADKMRQVHHPFQTQKNEALQKQMTALCPKDKFFGGSNQMHDRARLLVVLDSLGEFEGFNRLYHSLGLPPLNDAMAWWAVQKDNQDGCMHEFRKRPEVKKKRAGDKMAAWKEGMRKNKRAKTSGVTYESGIANSMAGTGCSVGKRKSTSTAGSAKSKMTKSRK